jgi:hypothetical protein
VEKKIPGEKTQILGKILEFEPEYAPSNTDYPRFFLIGLASPFQEQFRGSVTRP